MTKKILSFLVLASIAFSSCTKEDSIDDSIVIDASQKDPLSAQQINAKIDESINTKGSFNWSEAVKSMGFRSIFSLDDTIVFDAKCLPSKFNNIRLIHASGSKFRVF